jgi:hypothetical protein
MGGKDTPNVWERQHVTIAPLSPCNLGRAMLRTVQRQSTRGQDIYFMWHGGRASTIVSIALLFVFLQPAYANGEHVHVGGLFLVLLGGIVFLGSFVVVFYFLLRATPEEVPEEQESEE